LLEHNNDNNNYNANWIGPQNLELPQQETGRRLQQKNSTTTTQQLNGQLVGNCDKNSKAKHSM
jgi:hypothetical protein